MQKVSIIIPVYNVEKYLRRCLDSVLNQTLDDIEVICINDASGDKSLEILREYEQKDTRLKLINLEENKGAAYARNQGLDAAKGEFLGFVDPDDAIDLNYYEVLYNKAIEDNADIVKAVCERTDIDGNVSVSKLNDEIKNNKYAFTHEWWCGIYKASMVFENKIRFPDECRKAEDVFFLNRCVMSSKKLSLVDNVYYYYYRRNDSLDAPKIPVESVESAVLAYRLILNNINESALFEDNREQYLRYYNRFSGGNFYNFFKNDTQEAKKLYITSFIDNYHACKDVAGLDKIFAYKWMLPYIKKRNTEGLLNRMLKYKSQKDLQNKQRSLLEQIFSVIIRHKFKFRNKRKEVLEKLGELKQQNV